MCAKKGLQKREREDGRVSSVLAGNVDGRNGCKFHIRIESITHT